LIAELYVGGATVRGLFLGGFASAALVLAPSFQYADVGYLSRNGEGPQLAFVEGGLYLDYEPIAAQGFHVLVTLGYGGLNHSEVYTPENFETGFAAGMGLGYQLAISRRWSLGVLGRFTFARLNRGGGSAGATLSAVLLSFDYR
jgi:hypothetical protein